jgi:hypothetical protein
VAADPNDARAWTGLAWAHQLAVNFGADWESSNGLALEAAERAVALDPNDRSILGSSIRNPAGKGGMSRSLLK